MKVLKKSNHCHQQKVCSCSRKFQIEEVIMVLKYISGDLTCKVHIVLVDNILTYENQNFRPLPADII